MINLDNLDNFCLNYKVNQLSYRYGPINYNIEGNDNLNPIRT